ncbi:MAG: glycosyltransferase [Parcubacteria group bacterium Gr01-1014_106]|nr:MAG: glycosyltransferase [Parcubacteria group bacterium Gr01-1014_106]
MTAHIQIVGRNHRQYLQACIASCLQQTIPVPVLYVDNASSDDSAAFVERTFPSVQVIENHTNRGYSGGHNDGIRAYPNSDIVVVLNPDVVLAPDFVERGLDACASERVGAVAPLLLRPGGDTVDAYGDRQLLTLRPVNQYADMPLARFEHLHRTQEPWGYTGAAAFLRRRALDDIAVGGEMFDEDFFAYREDADLSWRLRNRGWHIHGAPAARATHVRAVRAGEPKHPFIAQLSWRNYALLLLKNASLVLLLTHLPWVLAESIARGVQLLLSPSLRPAFPELVRLIPSIRAKRKFSLST